MPNDVKDFVVRYHEYLVDYTDIVSSLRAENISLYRWTHNPTIADDELPQIFQNTNPLTPEDIVKPDAEAPFSVKLNYIGYFALSHFTTVEDALSRFRKIYAKRKSQGQQKADSFVEQTGGWIVKINYTPLTARLTEPDRNGHVNVFLAEGVNINELIDKDFDPINILDYDNES